MNIFLFLFRARPLSVFEKERGDKNIIKLPGDGAVWVSVYCMTSKFFTDCMAKMGARGDIHIHVHDLGTAGDMAGAWKKRRQER